VQYFVAYGASFEPSGPPCDESDDEQAATARGATRSKKEKARSDMKTSNEG